MKVFVGKGECNVTSVATNQLTCKPPLTQPEPLTGSGYPEVYVSLFKLVLISPKRNLIRFYQRPMHLSIIRKGISYFGQRNSKDGKKNGVKCLTKQTLFTVFLIMYVYI